MRCRLPRPWAAWAMTTILGSVLLCACAGAPPAQGPEAPPPLRDLVVLPQDALAYAPPESLDKPLFAPELARRLWEQWLKAWYAPWRRSRPKYGRDEVARGLDELSRGVVYGANLLPWPAGTISDLAANSGLEDYPNLGRPAVAVANTGMRVAPASRPAFRDPAGPGQGFPFDLLQNTAVFAGTPLFACHVSRDGAWVLCETETVYGWLPAADLAWVDEEFMSAYRTPGHLAFTQEDTPVVSCWGAFRFMGRVGMVLPRIVVLGEDGAHFDILIPAPDERGQAVLLTAAVPRDAAAPAPLPPTRRSLALLANQLLGRAYGWGGLYGERDCSATVLDLFAPLGLALPRNSARQAEAGLVFPLEGLAVADKRRAILDVGVPWLTLLRKPGHIMLYVGTFKGTPEGVLAGEPVVLQTIWGVRTVDDQGREGRRIVGRTVITSLGLGADLPDAAPGGTLLERLTAMTVLVPQALEREPYPINQGPGPSVVQAQAHAHLP